MRACIYTAIFGGYESLKPPLEPSREGVDLICFSDFPHSQANGWRSAQRHPAFAVPRMDAKWYRMNSDLVLPEYDVTIWVDASFQLGNVDQFVAACLKDLGPCDTALFRHPERSNIYDEAEAPLNVWARKYADQPLLEQVARYRWEGLPDDHILWAGGIQVRRARSRLVSEINRRWFAECVRWSFQDQLSLPYVLWDLRAQGLVGTLEGSVYRGPNHEWEKGPDR